MADDAVVMERETAEDAGVSRVYEAGYHIMPTVKEEDIEKTVARIRGIVEKAGGSFIAEGAPVLMRLSFPIYPSTGGKKNAQDRAYFGWLKFESPVSASEELAESLKKDPEILRSIVFRTVREETRAKMKAPQLREVKRTDTLKSMPRKSEESAPVSEEQIDKAIETLTLD
ncbi:30S ribosomal protein S6 [Candidatus Kaiserbacteria bacterium]|nr:30S ribosomal protein S6 [Candidatus Kaiserbacteria bacterium]